MEPERPPASVELDEDEDLNVYVGDEGDEENRFCRGQNRFKEISLGEYGIKRNNPHLRVWLEKWEGWKKQVMNWRPSRLGMKMGSKDREGRGKREREKFLQRVCGGMVGVVFTVMLLL